MRCDRRSLLTIALAIAFTTQMSCHSATDSASGKSVAAPADIGGIWIPIFQMNSKDPDDVEIEPRAQFTAEYQAKYESNKAIYIAASTVAGAGAAAADSILVRRQAECLPYGMPRMMTVQQSLDIVQAENRILMIGEIEREVRRIWLDREQLPLEDVDLTYFGRSVGKWEGDTLVVNTIGIRPDLEGQNYMPHSEQMVITERLSLQEGILVDEVTITDPVALQKPWVFTYRLERAPKDYEPTEFVCDTQRFRVGERGNIIAE